MYRSDTTDGLVPSGPCTTTSTVAPPAGPGGTWATSEVSEDTRNDAPADPNLTEVAPEKSDPLTTTVPPPKVGPLPGTTPLTWGETKVYSPAGTVALVPPAGPLEVTVTPTCCP